MSSTFVTSRLNGSEWMESKGLKYAIYALIFGIVLAVALIIADLFYPFLPINPMSGPSSVARSGQTFWKTATASSENLIVPSSVSPTVIPDVYTMSVQIMISDSRTTPKDNGKFRHLVHRGSDSCILGPSAKTAGPSGHSGIQQCDLKDNPNMDPSYNTNGLPSIMNPGLFLDEFTNDLHIFIHTLTKEAVAGNNEIPVLTLEGCTVYDLPLKTPITIGIVCNGNTVEVYVNCLLYQTILLRGKPYLPAGNNQWFGRYCAFPMTGLVQNLQLWSAALTSADYMQVCRTPSFDMSQLQVTMPTIPDMKCSKSYTGMMDKLTSGPNMSALQSSVSSFAARL